MTDELEMLKKQFDKNQTSVPDKKNRETAINAAMNAFEKEKISSRTTRHGQWLTAG